MIPKAPQIELSCCGSFGLVFFVLFKLALAILWARRRSEKLGGTRKTWPLMHSKSIMQIDLLFLYSSHSANDVLLNLMTSNMHVRYCCTLSGPRASHVSFEFTIFVKKIDIKSGEQLTDKLRAVGTGVAEAISNILPSRIFKPN